MTIVIRLYSKTNGLWFYIQQQQQQQQQQQPPIAPSSHLYPTYQINTRRSSPSIIMAMLCPYGMLVNLISL